MEKGNTDIQIVDESQHHEKFDVYRQRKRLFLYSLSFLALISTTAYQLIEFFNKEQPADPFIRSILIPVSLINIILLRFSHKEIISSVLFVLLGFTIELSIVYTLPPTNLYTLCIIPMLCLFLLGRQIRLILSIVFAFMVLPIAFMNPPRFAILFPNNLALDVLITYIITTVVIYLYQDSTTKIAEMILSRSTMILENHKDLREQIALRKSIELELAKRVEEFRKKKEEAEKINRQMLEREMEMIELKKKIAELKNRASI